MQTLIITLISILFLYSATNHAQEIKNNVELIIIESFEKDVHFTFHKYKLSSDIKRNIEFIVKQKFYNDAVFIYEIYGKDTIVAYGFLDNVIGKSMPITFFVLINVEGTIISSSIIKYREPYGGAVSNETWNKQFTGKNSESDFMVGSSVNGISGATISVNSVTKGIRKLILLYEKIKDDI